MDYGAAPTPDQLEVTLFGPGFGEAVAVHLGDGAWMLVDSCIDPELGLPATLVYLEQLGVDRDRVRVIVASHWHDDHIRGFAQLAEACPNADIVISTVFDQKEARAFLAAYGGDSSAGLSRGATELFEVIRGRHKVHHALHRTIVLEDMFAGRNVRITALSPLSAALSKSIAHMAWYLPAARRPNKHAPHPEKNLEAMVLHIDLQDDAVLLGADLEEHQEFGWSGLLQDSWCSSRRPSSIYKVAHHGSLSGDCAAAWRSLMVPGVTACLTPFNLGAIHLPDEDDRKRIKARTPNRYLTSGASRSPEMDSRLLKRLKDICTSVSRADPTFGAVRLRKKQGWEVELFGAAQPL